MVNGDHRLEDAPAFESATAGDVMSRGVISCSPETPLRVVAKMMATHGVHAIFVFEHADEDDEDPQLWAVVSDLDLVAATRLDLDSLTAGATAVTPLVSVATECPIAEAGSLMAQYGSPISPSPILIRSARSASSRHSTSPGRSRPGLARARPFPPPDDSGPQQPAGLGSDHELLARGDDLDAEIAEEADALDDPLAYRRPRARRSRR